MGCLYARKSKMLADEAFRLAINRQIRQSFLPPKLCAIRYRISINENIMLSGMLDFS